MLRKLSCSVALSALLLSGCTGEDGSMNKAQMGTVVGGLAGGLLGSQVGSGTGQVLAIGAGAVAGAALGNYLGARLDERDRAAASQAVAQALQAKGSEQIAWSNPRSGNHGTVLAEPVRYEKAQRLSGSSSAPPALAPPPRSLDPAPDVWTAPSTVNLRAGPGTDAAVVGRLRPRRNFEVLGQVPGSEWLVVAERGRPVGYVSRKVVRVFEPPAPALPPVQTADATGQNGGLVGPPDPAPPSSAAAPGMMVDPAAIDRSVGTAGPAGGAPQVACRTTVSTVQLKGEAQPQVSKAKFCQQADGTWAPAEI